MAKASERQKICVVIPAFNEEGNLVNLLGSLIKALKGELFEIILVDDGSSDGTVEVLCKIKLREQRIRLIKLTRNFGHPAAVLAGLEHGKDADAIIVMDADLQHPPSILPKMISTWRMGYMVVRMQRKNYAHSFFKTFASRIFYWLAGILLKNPPIPRSPEFMLLDKQVVTSVLGLNDKEFTLRGIVSWLSYKTAILPFQEGSRQAGKSGYGLMKSCKLAYATLFYQTIAPLRLGAILGIILGTMGIVASVSWAGWHVIAKGYLSKTELTILGLIFISSFQVVIMSVICEYLGVVVRNIKRIPPYVASDEDKIKTPRH